VLRQQLGERSLALGEHRDADQVVGDRRDIGLGARRPVHLHV
jgi:hypothetical protein